MYSQRRSLENQPRIGEERKDGCESVDEGPELYLQASNKQFGKRKEINIPFSISVPQILD
jgi:hypothetical protein